MNDTKGLMAGKRGLIMGVANNRSIAWGIAQACARHGAELAFTYQGDAIKNGLSLAAEFGAKLLSLAMDGLARWMHVCAIERPGGSSNSGSRHRLFGQGRTAGR